nr:hypothetical protein [uncultured Oscillibacter sp.]
MLALTGGAEFSHIDGWADAPPIFSFRRAEKRKRAVHGPKEKRALLVVAEVHSIYWIC